MPPCPSESILHMQLCYRLVVANSTAINAIGCLGYYVTVSRIGVQWHLFNPHHIISYHIINQSRTITNRCPHVVVLQQLYCSSCAAASVFVSVSRTGTVDTTGEILRKEAGEKKGGTDNACAYDVKWKLRGGGVLRLSAFCIISISITIHTYDMI